MAVYSTFFLATPDELISGFPGWKLPLSEPVTRTWTSPFLDEEVTTTSYEPDWDDVDPSEIEFPEPTVVAIEGDYAAYLEQRIPPAVQSQPHWCAKGLTRIEVEPLIEAATGMEDVKLMSALFAHPELGCGIDILPNEFISRLKEIGASGLNKVAKKWATIMSKPEFTHSVSGDRLTDDWVVNDAIELLIPIFSLVEKQSDGQEAYLLVES